MDFIIDHKLTIMTSPLNGPVANSQVWSHMVPDEGNKIKLLESVAK